MIRIAFIFLLVLVLAVPVAGWWLMQRSLPSLEGVATVRGLENPVIVKFDGRGIPYIESRSDNDLYMAQGYLMARDRMFQMDILRRTALGELSEVFGLSALPSDKLMRTIGFRRLSTAELNYLSPEAKASLESFARGVNAYLLGSADVQPLEFLILGYKPRAWEPIDSLAIFKYWSYTLDESWALDDFRQRASSKLGKDLTGQLFHEEWGQTPVISKTLPLDQIRNKLESGHFLGKPNGIWGSNAWVLSSRHSKSGGCLLACDKHYAYSSPDLFYISSLTSPLVHAAGATIAGVPGIMAGRNDNIAWSSAGLKGDTQDLFLEEFNPQSPSQYRTEAGWDASGEVREEIGVRFGKNFLHKVSITGHGPVLLRNGNTGVSLAWSLDKTDKSSLEALYRLNRASNWREFLRALESQSGPSEGFVFADRSGTFGLQAAGLLPVRSNFGQGTMLTPGWLQQGQWKSSLDFDDLPSTASPAEGFVVAANQKLVSSKYPRLIGHQWAAPYRAYRIASVLSSYAKTDQKASLINMSELQSDQFCYLSTLVKQELTQSIAKTDLIDRIQLNALEILDHWDGQLRTESTAATIYEAFLHTLARRLVEPKLGPAMTEEYLERWSMWPLFLEYYLKNHPRVWLPPEERTHSTFMLTTFSQALKDLRINLGEATQDKWQWGHAHQATFLPLTAQVLPWMNLLFNAGPFAIGGDQDTVNANNVIQSLDRRLGSNSGPIMRLLVDMADQDKLYLSTSLGQSGQLFSPYRQDQLKAWLRCDPLPVAFSAAQLDKQMQSKLILSDR